MTTQIKRPNGVKTYACHMSRHFGNARLYGAYEVVCRLSRANSTAVSIAGKPRRAMFNGKISTFADALGISKGTAGNLLLDLVEVGALIAFDEKGELVRMERGRFAAHYFEVVLHDEYSLTDPCPEHRFQRNNGRVQSVIKSRRKQHPERAQRFEKPCSQCGKMVRRPAAWIAAGELYTANPSKWGGEGKRLCEECAAALRADRIQVSEYRSHSDF